LIQIGVTPASIAQAISDTPCAWVAELDSEVIGFSMVQQDDGCLFAAFVVPEHEGKGVGTRLIQIAERVLFEHHDVAWLETAEGSRAASLYRHLGWNIPTDIGNGDV
jgi:GNAT superfamily N-acetyltransferase